nr:hypothetical protein [Tanacetum cinerariifolium]
MALISTSFKKIYKPTNNNLKTSSNTRNKNVDNTSRTDKSTGYDRQTGKYENQRAVNVVGNKDTVEHPEQLEYTNDTYVVEQGDSKTILDSLNMSNNEGEVNQDKAKLQEECPLLASLIDNMKLEINESKQMNKSLKTVNMSLGKEIEKYKDIKCVKVAKIKCVQAYG